jgi:hypothetical protein
MWKTALLPVLIIMVSLGQGCAGTRQSDQTQTRIVCGICEEADRFVRLQTRPTRPGGEETRRFAHPFQLSSEDWIAVLASIHVQTRTTTLLFFSAKQPAASAFSPEEIDYLSVTLSKAFAEARPEEWVVFGLSRPGTSGVTEMTTGGWFLEGTTLHLVLANHRCPVSMPGVRELLTRDPLIPNTGGTFELVVGDHQAVVKDADTLPSLFGPTPSELSIDYKPLLLARLPERPVKAGEGRAEPVKPSGLSIEESMALLKRLRDQGLITDAEYDAKKKQLLDRF